MIKIKQKFKKFNLNYRNRTIDFPLKLLKFKRTKWNALTFFLKNRKRLPYFFRVKSTNKNPKTKNKKISIYSNLNKNINIINRVGLSNFKLQSSLKKWDRINDTQKISLNVRRHLYQTYDYSISLRQIKKQIFLDKETSNRIEFFKKILKFEFRIDIMLLKTRFFNSTSECRKFINNKNVKVNSKFIKGNYFLTKGDIITIDNYSTNFEIKLSKLKKTFLIYNCFEIDYHTNTIIVLRSFDEISESELPFFFKKYFDIQNFKHSFK